MTDTPDEQSDIDQLELDLLLQENEVQQSILDERTPHMTDFTAQQALQLLGEGFDIPQEQIDRATKFISDHIAQEIYATLLVADDYREANRVLTQQAVELEARIAAHEENKSALRRLMGNSRLLSRYN